MELLGKSREELQAYFREHGEPAYRGGQIYHALYAERKFDVGSFTNLPVALREKLRQEATVTLPVVRQRYKSSDGSVRYLFGLSERERGDGWNTKKSPVKPAAVEAVFMPSEGRQTICISTQAGCAVDCQFCLTAKLGLIRNLTAGEMLAQVLLPMVEMDGKESAESGEGLEEGKDGNSAIAGADQRGADGSGRADAEF